MKAVIRKYVLVLGDNKVWLPRTGKTLSVGWQGEDLAMWVLLLSPGFPHQQIERRFMAVVTGEEFERSNTDEYVGTAECARNGIVAHVFEVKS